MASQWPQEGPRGTQEAPRWRQSEPSQRPRVRGGFKWHCAYRLRPPNGAKMAPRWPHDGPKMAPRWPQEGPRWPQEASRWPQSEPSERPRIRGRFKWHCAYRLPPSQMMPRWPQDGPRGLHESPKRAQEGSKRTQDGHKMAQHGHKFQFHAWSCSWVASGGPAGPPDGPHMAPRWLQAVLRWPQGGTTIAQEGPACILGSGRLLGGQAYDWAAIGGVFLRLGLRLGTGVWLGV